MTQMCDECRQTTIARVPSRNELRDEYLYADKRPHPGQIMADISSIPDLHDIYDLITHHNGR